MKNIVGCLLGVSEGGSDIPLLMSFLVDIEADNIYISGDPDNKLFEKFEEFAFENYSGKNQVRVFASRDYQELVEESDVLHEEAVDYFRYDVPSQVIETLGESSIDDRTLVFADKEYLGKVRNLLDDGIRSEITGIYR